MNMMIQKAIEAINVETLEQGAQIEANRDLIGRMMRTYVLCPSCRGKSQPNPLTKADECLLCEGCHMIAFRTLMKAQGTFPS